MSFFSNVFAANPTTASSSQASGLMSFLPMIIIFGLFWLLLIRPQQKKMKQHNQMLASLVKGTQVLTSGGLVGTIVKLEDGFIDLEVANGVIMKFQRAAITGKLDTAAAQTK